MVGCSLAYGQFIDGYTTEESEPTSPAAIAIDSPSPTHDDLLRGDLVQVTLLVERVSHWDPAWARLTGE